MVSKYIDNASYATSGYLLSSPLTSLTIGTKGTIGGPGIRGDGGFTVDNKGTVISNRYGIVMSTTYRFGAHSLGTVINSGLIKGGDYAVRAYAIVNMAGGLIEGGTYGVTTKQLEGQFQGTINNQGTILATGSNGIGVDFYNIAGYGNSNASMTNGVSGLIESRVGIGLSASAIGTIVNSGTIRGGGTSRYYRGAGVDLKFVGLFSNMAGGVIESSGVGLYAVAVTNSGTISGGGVSSRIAGVELFDANLMNTGSGVIKGETGLYVGAEGNDLNYITNYGIIEGVIGATSNADFEYQATLVNFGTIASTQGAVGTAVSFGGADALLVDEAGSVFIGKVIGGGSTLHLAGNGGHLSGLGSSFSGFGSVDVVASASWTISGANSVTAGETLSVAGGATLVDTGTIATSTGLLLGSSGGGAAHFEILAHDTFDLVNAASLRFAVGGSGSTVNNGLFEKTGNASESVVRGIFDNTGTVAVAAGTLDFSGQITGGGHLSIGGTGTLEFDLSVAATETVTFAGSAATLLLIDVGAFKAAIDGFDAGGSGDRIDVAGFDTGTTVKFTQPKSGETVATLTDGKTTASVALFGQYSAAGFGFTVSSTGTVVTYSTPPAEVALAGATSPSHR